jgi:hypothetical protein
MFWHFISFPGTTKLVIWKSKEKREAAMTEEQITEFVDQIEAMWLENFAAKKYLKYSCGFRDPADFLEKEIQRIPKKALLHHFFAPVRKAIGQGLEETELFETLQKVLAKPLKQ